MAFREPLRRLYDGENAIGSGVARSGRWEARALVTSPYPGDPPGLFVWLQLWSTGGRPVGGGGCGPARLADAEVPLDVAMSGQKPPHWFYYLGQAVPDCTAVDLHFAGGAVVRASMLEPDLLPVKLWVAFTDGPSQLQEISGFNGEDSFPAVAIEEQPSDHPGNRNVSWSRPLYEEDDEPL